MALYTPPAHHALCTGNLLSVSFPRGATVRWSQTLIYLASQIHYVVYMTNKASSGNGKIEDKVKNQINTMLSNTIIKDRKYLDDEQLDRDTQFQVLSDIFDANVRDKEIKEITSHFAPIMRGGQPIHMACTGKTGTGKTVCLLYLVRLLSKMSAKKNIGLRYEHIDLSTPRPCFRAINDIACLLNASRRYKKGISLEEMMGKIEDALSDYRGYLVLLIDEIDNVRTDLDTFMKFLVRRLPQKFPGKLILIFVSNQLGWAEDLDPRVQSFNRMQDLIFPPYDACDLRRILDIRVRKALNEDMLEEGIVQKIAALASQHHGDARKAVELLARSASLAEKQGTKICLSTVDQANEEIEKDKYVDLIKTSPKQLQAALYSVLTASPDQKKLTTSEAYEQYQRFCELATLRELTHRAFSDLIGELDLMGFVRCRVRSHGRYGRKREIRPSVPQKIRDELLKTVLLNFDIPRKRAPEVIGCNSSKP